MKYKVTTTNSNNETKTIEFFDNYEDSLVFLQELIKIFHTGAKVELSKNQAQVVTEIGIEINYEIIEERI
jgi:hypothetical protein